jgi:ABC-type Na+ efflux pump permease subunit
MTSAQRRMIAVGVGVLFLAAAVVVTRAAPSEGPVATGPGGAGPLLRRCPGSRWRGRPACGCWWPATRHRPHTFVVLLMVAVGYAVGFGYLLSWISALIGLTVHDPETAGTASLLPVIPLAFTSSTFVPVATRPGWLQAWANSNPITHAVDSTRVLALGGPTSRPLPKAAAWIPGPPGGRHPLPIYRCRRVTQ